MKTIGHLIGSFILLSIFSGCEQYADDYKDYLDKKEIVYPGLARNVRYHAGNLRAVLVWNPSPDPSIAKYVISWNNNRDSTVMEALTHNPEDSITLSVPDLQEYVYSFRILAYDNAGNVSIGQELNNVRVYGPVYQSTLLNRLVESAVKDGDDTEIALLASDPSSPFSEITYTTSEGGERVIRVDSSASNVKLPAYKSGSSFHLRSYFLPDSSAIDTFQVSTADVYGVDENVTTQYIKNPGHPFYRGDDGSGKWGLPKNWLYNTNVVNQNGNTAGGWSTDDGGVIHFETQDWEGAGVDNGKIYQTFTLPAGTYSIDFETGNYGGTMNVNELVVAGTVLPDIGSTSGVLASFSANENTIGGTHTLTFTLASATNVSIGWVVNTGQYTYLQFRSVSLKALSGNQ